MGERGGARRRGRRTPVSVPVRLPGTADRAEPATDAHPPSTDLVGYARGMLTSARAASIRAHCESCVACGGELGALLLLRTASLGAGGTTIETGG